MATFGERLKRLREARGWSQQDLADESGVPYITIYRCERGLHQEPRVGVAAKLARALGVSLDVHRLLPHRPYPPHPLGLDGGEELALHRQRQRVDRVQEQGATGCRFE